ncbi:hypothetical protein [Zeaxanthinibacter enoshimensis]|uniref:hypothetical protein n=1 Tax=Zeaxanthinibacter enoshimensis TaxID=392009 RepID=UPI0035660150
MKNRIHFTLYTFLLGMTLLFTACQSEFEELPEDNQQQTLEANSSTAVLIERTASNDGSFDNIVDQASCLAIQFPYEVNVNGEILIIESREDLQLIEDIFDASDIDDDFLELVFPITVTTGAYADITINSREGLRELAADCIENGEDDDIECIDFVYPLTLFTFDRTLQQTSRVTVENDRQLRFFFKELGEDQLASFSFPISLELYDGTVVEVNSNEQLARLIEENKDACDEDDDNDYNDDDFTQERLNEYLVECPWLVHEMVRDQVNQTDQYFEYLMNFGEDGKVYVKDRIGNTLIGTWTTRVSDNNRVLLKLEFDVLVDFNLEWFVYEIGEGTIKLFSEGGNKIIMKRFCDAPDPGATLRNILKECAWVIKKVKNQGEEIERLLGYEFNFHAEGVVTLSNSINISEGEWEVTTNNQGILVLAIAMGAEPAVNFEWPVRDLMNQRLKFEVEDIGYELILQRVCEDNGADGDVVEIRELMKDGPWRIASFIDSEIDEADLYTLYSFSFEAEHIMSMTLGETGTTEAGLWRVLRNSEGKLKVYLNGGENEPLNELTDDWDFYSADAGRIELRSESDASGQVKILVFERN